MRILLVVAVAFWSSTAFAQEAAPPIEQPAPEPLEQEEMPQPSPPPPVDKPAPAPAPAQPTPEPSADAGGCLAIGLGSGLSMGVLALIGGTTLCVGGTLANFTGTSSGGDCVSQCIDALFQAAVISIGVIISIAGLIVLGPGAAIAATVGAALAAGAAERQVWPSVLGGSIGIVTGTIGLALMVSGVFDPSPYPFVASEPLDVSRPSHIMVAAGLGMVATAGLVSVVGAIALDATLGGPDETAKPQPSPGPPPGSTTAMLALRPRAQAY